jgi:hypothetical protein
MIHTIRNHSSILEGHLEVFLRDPMFKLRKEIYYE